MSVVSAVRPVRAVILSLVVAAVPSFVADGMSEMLTIVIIFDVRAHDLIHLKNRKKHVAG